MIRGLLLAGGASRRYGAPKLLQPHADGVSLGAYCARRLVAHVGNVLAVTRPGDDELARQLEQAGCDVLVTARALEGMGASLAAAVEAASGAEGWIVALADMPRIHAQTYAEVKRVLQLGARIVAPIAMDSGMRGHPVGFAASLGDELRLLGGDLGARPILARHAHEVFTIPVDDPGILFDIDTP